MSRALTTIGVLGVLVAVVAALGLDGGSSYRVQVELPDAAGIVKRSDVKLDGVTVGSVKRLELSSRDTARAVLEIDSSVAPLGRGASVRVRPSNLLGEKFLDLRVGDPRAPLRSGASIAAGPGAVELDDVLDTLDDPTRARLAIFLNELGVAMLGHGGDLNALLGQLPPALSDTSLLVRRVTAENRRLGDLIDDAERFTTVTAGRRRELGRLVEQADGALAATAARHRALGDTVAQAPGTLRQLDRSLRKLTAVARPLRPASRSLRAATPALIRTLRAIPGFAASAGPTLNTAADTAPALERLGARGRAPVAQLRELLAQLAPFTGKLAPVTRAADQEGGVRGLLGLVNGWTGDVRNADGVGHYFRIHGTLDETLITSLVDRIVALRGTRPSKRPRRTERRPVAPPVAPVLRPRPQELPGLLDDLLRPTKPTAPATNAVDDLLDFLLGP